MNQHLDEEELPRITTEHEQFADDDIQAPLPKEALDRLELSTFEGLREKNKYFPILAPEKTRSRLNFIIPDEYLLNQKGIQLRDFKKEHYYKIGNENHYKFPKLHKPEDYPAIQSSYFNDGGLKNQSRLDRVSKAFDKSWQTYTEFGYGHDEVLPLTHEPEDPFNGWAVTLVDSLDTLFLMKRKQEFQKAVKFISSMNFKQSFREDIPLFENVIRVLAGLMSGYELSEEAILLQSAKDLAELLMEAFDTPNHMPLLYYQWKDEIQNKFAAKDASLAEVGSLSLEFSRLTQLTKDNKYFDAITRITKAFETSNNEGFLMSGLYPNRLDISGCNILADSDIEQGVHLNNPKVIKAIRGGQYVHCLLTGTIQPMGDVNQKYSVGGLSDSFYEYLPKMYHLLRGGDSKHAATYKDLYLKALKEIKEYMVFKPRIPDNKDILFISSISANKRPNLKDTGEDTIEIHQEFDMEHLSCFAGGMFALGSRLFDIPEDMELAGNITYGCVDMYRRMKIMPEILWVDKEKSPTDVFDEKKRLALINPNSSLDNTKGSASVNEKRSKSTAREKNEGSTTLRKVIIDKKPNTNLPKQQVLSNGEKIWPVGNVYDQPIWVNKLDSKYILRPEAIESVFYMYRITGDSKWRELGWMMWENIENFCQSPSGEFASMLDVTKVGRNADGNDENFVDVLESFWFSETLKYFYLLFEDVSVWSLDEFVYNTEAHPFKLA